MYVCLIMQWILNISKSIYINRCIPLSFLSEVNLFNEMIHNTKKRSFSYCFVFSFGWNKINFNPYLCFLSILNYQRIHCELYLICPWRPRQIFILHSDYLLCHVQDFVIGQCTFLQFIMNI